LQHQEETIRQWEPPQCAGDESEQAAAAASQQEGEQKHGQNRGQKMKRTRSHKEAAQAAGHGGHCNRGGAASGRKVFD